jgi:hypothetical protein
MGLRDALRSLRGNPGEDETEEEAASSDVPEPTLLSPRSDGIYEGGPDPDGDGALFLQFGGGKVREIVAPDAAAARTTGAPRVGEYGAAGRFMVQERFERPVIFTVLDSDADGFTARRTNSATGNTSELRYTFVPTAAAEAAGS